MDIVEGAPPPPPPDAMAFSPCRPMTPQRAQSVVGVVLDEDEDPAASLAQLLERPGYQRHLRSCGASQEIMLGHASTRLREEVKAMLRGVAEEYGVALKFTAGILEGAPNHKIVALVDTAPALATPGKELVARKVFADATNTAADDFPKGRERERSGCWCRK